MKVVSLVVTLVISYSSPFILFAQDLNARPAAPEIREKGEEGPDIRLSPRVPIPDMQWGTEGSDVRLGWSPTNTEHRLNSGDVIAVLTVTVRDNDVVDTGSEERTDLPEELLVQDNYPNPFRNCNTNCFPPARTGTGVCRDFRRTWSCGLYFTGAAGECRVGSHTVAGPCPQLVLACTYTASM